MVVLLLRSCDISVNPAVTFKGAFPTDFSRQIFQWFFFYIGLLNSNDNLITWHSLSDFSLGTRQGNIFLGQWFLFLETISKLCINFLSESRILSKLYGNFPVLERLLINFANTFNVFELFLSSANRNVSANFPSNLSVGLPLTGRNMRVCRPPPFCPTDWICVEWQQNQTRCYRYRYPP